MIAFRFFNSAFWEVLRRELRKSRHNLHLRFPAVFPVLRQRTLRLACRANYNIKPNKGINNHTCFYRALPVYIAPVSKRRDTTAYFVSHRLLEMKATSAANRRRRRQTKLTAHVDGIQATRCIWCGYGCCSSRNPISRTISIIPVDHSDQAGHKPTADTWTWPAASAAAVTVRPSVHSAIGRRRPCPVKRYGGSASPTTEGTFLSVSLTSCRCKRLCTSDALKRSLFKQGQVVIVMGVNLVWKLGVSYVLVWKLIVSWVATTQQTDPHTCSTGLRASPRNVYSITQIFLFLKSHHFDKRPHLIFLYIIGYRPNNISRRLKDPHPKIPGVATSQPPVLTPMVLMTVVLVAVVLGRHWSCRWRDYWDAADRESRAKAGCVGEILWPLLRTSALVNKLVLYALDSQRESQNPFPVFHSTLADSS